jgi:hypothetical protein
MNSHKSKKTVDSNFDEETTIRNLYRKTINGWNKGRGDY